MSDDIGVRLHEIRMSRRLSQRELAKRVGVTDATISNIESNRVSPSVASIKKIVGGLGMSLAEFFAYNQPSERKIFYRSDELSEIGHAPISYRQVGANLSECKLQVLHERYPPGSDSGPHISHEGEEAGVIVQGCIELTVGDETRMLGPGDAYYFESRTPHRMRNTGDEPCELVSVCTPPTF